MTSMIIDPRFCGPKQSANGGYAAGVFAQAIKGPAEVTLKSPPPLGAPIEIRARGDGAVDAVYDDKIIASVRPGEVVIDPPDLPDEAAIDEAHNAYLADRAMTRLYPYCFVCGKEREAGDGMRIFAGPAPGSPVNIDRWRPDDSLADQDGLVRAEFLWAALDCPGAFALRFGGDNALLLGRLTGEVRRRPNVGEALKAAAWRVGQEGRKHFSSSAIFDRAGEIVAGANAVWIELADTAMVDRLRRENA